MKPDNLFEQTLLAHGRRRRHCGPATVEERPFMAASKPSQPNKQWASACGVYFPAPSKCASISSNVFPLVSGRKKAAVTK